MLSAIGRPPRWHVVFPYLRVVRAYQGAIARISHACQRRAMTIVKTFGTRLEADLASILLRAEGIAATVVGVGLAMEGGAEGVRLLVPDEQADAALELLEDE